MKKNIAPLLIGIIFILAGLGYVGSIFFNWDFSIFFDGWWTLFIIIPAFVSMLANGPRSFNIAALIVGGILLLSAQNIIPAKYLGTVIVAAVILYIGLVLVIHYIRGPKPQNYIPPQAPPYTYVNTTTTTTDENGTTHTTYSDNYQNQYAYTPNNNNQKNDYNNYNATQSDNAQHDNYASIDNDSTPSYNAILSGINAKNTSTDFLGARLSAVMGGVDLDLRDVIIKQDVTVCCTAFMGGIDIFAPNNVRIAIKRTDILGSTSCKAQSMPADAVVPLLTFDCTAIMGGIDIK